MESSVTAIDAAAWDALDHGGSPFLRHGFLAALEASGSVGPRSGWQPAYVTVHAAGALVGAVAAYVKQHSYGEYIFDWAWARASQRAGVPYYPKLVIAAPMTPATGPRVLLADPTDERVFATLVAAVRELAEATACASIHWLFCTEAEQARLAAHGFSPRASLQFHWRSRGYTSWDEFLAALTSRKRKQLRKERARAQAAVDEIAWRQGADLAPALLADVDRWYRTTVDAHGGQDYLRPGFFEACAARCADTMRVVEVTAAGQRVAGAVFFETDRALYGRYWGADAHVELLHFEAAYYQGIERCIARGLPLFEAGAQGEHKLLRGFEPAATYSAHWLREPRLHAAVEGFLVEEAREVAAQRVGLAAYGPYKVGDADEA